MELEELELIGEYTPNSIMSLKEKMSMLTSTKYMLLTNRNLSNFLEHTHLINKNAKCRDKNYPELSRMTCPVFRFSLRCNYAFTKQPSPMQIHNANEPHPPTSMIS